MNIPSKPVILCILDGWGVEEAHPHNAITQAKTPVWDAMLRDFPHSTLETSGLAVGLPEGQMGNSEVGHMTIGSGRVIYQSLPRIDADIASGALARNPQLAAALGAINNQNGACHLMGLLSDGGVHAHVSHILALAQIAAQAGVKVVVHAILDGRDTPPQSARVHLEALLAVCAQSGGMIQLGTISGRYYAMDRDKRWDRVQKAYDAMVLADAPVVRDPLVALEASYQAGIHDEFFVPVVMDGYKGMQDGDGFVFANFRSDRARQLCGALVDPAFAGFARARVVKFSAKAGMVEYSDALMQQMTALYPVEIPKQTLGEVVSAAGKKQIRMAETEKYAHVTFFFNGGVEAVFPGEDRLLVDSPKVATYDLQPEMSAPELTEKLVSAIHSGTYDLIVVNFANPDMVGHTGILSAAIAAVETIDAALGRIQAAVLQQNGAMLISADHGNLECMHDDENNAPHTQHTTNLVPCVLITGQKKAYSLQSGGLSDLAPTVLQLMGLPQPAEMTGKSLITKTPA